METWTFRVKQGMAKMQKGGVIMDVMNAEQAKIAEAPVRQQLWHLNWFPQITALLVV